MKINAPGVGALTHASNLYISLRIQKLTESCVQPNIAGVVCFLMKKEVSGVFCLSQIRLKSNDRLGIIVKACAATYAC